MLLWSTVADGVDGFEQWKAVAAIVPTRVGIATLLEQRAHLSGIVHDDGECQWSGIVDRGRRENHPSAVGALLCQRRRLRQPPWVANTSRDQQKYQE